MANNKEIHYCEYWRPPSYISCRMCDFFKFERETMSVRNEKICDYCDCGICRNPTKKQEAME
jgi:hypothetical protein